MADRQSNPELDAQHKLGRIQSRKVESRRALQRLVGSYILGGVAAWQLLQWEPHPHVPGDEHGIPWLLVAWIGLAVLSFGLASWDQLAKVIRR